MDRFNLVILHGFNEELLLLLLWAVPLIKTIRLNLNQLDLLTNTPGLFNQLSS